ncbi:hypothetical protein ACOSQ3_003580 [Xanthoceras sorbifolium]
MNALIKKKLKGLTLPRNIPSKGKKASNSEMETNVLAGSLSGSTELLIDIEKLQESFEPAKKCCIFRVPRDLRKINEEAYTPQVVAIGPLHHGKEEYLIEMEKQKLRYVEKFGERTSMDKLMELRSFIEANEGKIHSFYAEHSNLSSDKFVTMILYVLEIKHSNNFYLNSKQILQENSLKN